MREEIWLLDFIRSNRFILYVAIFTVLFLSPNTYYVFHQFSAFSSPYKEIASAGVAFIVAASIMIYTLRKNYRMAKYYSVFEVTISAYYYITMIGFDWALIPAFGFTLVLPASVYHYTREIDVDLAVGERGLARFLEKNPDKKPSDFYNKK